LLNTARHGQGVGVMTTDQMAAWRRERRLLARVSRAVWRLEQGGAGTPLGAGLSPRGGGLHPCAGGWAGLSPARVHQITAGADLDGLDAALGELRAPAWPAPEDPGEDDDAELDGRDLICDRLLDEAGWMRQRAGWLTHLHTKEFPRWSTCAPKAIIPTGRACWPACPRCRDRAADRRRCR